MKDGSRSSKKRKISLNISQLGSKGIEELCVNNESSREKVSDCKLVRGLEYRTTASTVTEKEIPELVYDSSSDADEKDVGDVRYAKEENIKGCRADILKSLARRMREEREEKDRNVVSKARRNINYNDYMYKPEMPCVEVAVHNQTECREVRETPLSCVSY